MTATSDAMDFLMSSGAPPAKFVEIGDICDGTVVAMEKKQQTEVKTGALLTWKNGDPRYQVIFTVQTDQSDPSIEDDTGMRRVYAKGNMLGAIRGAIKKAGHEGSAIGGRLWVKYVADGTPPAKGFNAPKQFKAAFKPGVPPVDPDEREPGVDDDVPF